MSMSREAFDKLIAENIAINKPAEVETVAISKRLYEQFKELYVEVDYQVYSHWYNWQELTNKRNAVKEAMLKDKNVTHK